MAVRYERGPVCACVCKGRLASLGFPFHLSLRVLGKPLESVRVIAYVVPTVTSLSRQFYA